MCRNIKTLFNFDPPATDDEIRASSLQFVRKLSGSTTPSKANEVAFNQAVEEVSLVAHTLLGSLVTQAPSRNREVEAFQLRQQFFTQVILGQSGDQVRSDFILEKRPVRVFQRRVSCRQCS